MIHLAIGPERDVPSWNWVGFDTARELSKYFSITLFADKMPACQVALVVKRPLEPATIPAQTKVIYLPVDYFKDLKEVESQRPWLARCAAVGCHSERQIPIFQPCCRNVFFVEHHGRFTLPQIAPYRPSGSIVWLGAMENIPYLLHWLEDRPPLGYPLKILSNPGHKRALRRARVLCRQLKVDWARFTNILRGGTVVEWTERAQWDLMREAKAALDVKGSNLGIETDWQQDMKPPTKAQQFVSSGIPFAANAESYSCQYFQQRGFRLAQPEEQEWWLSHEYWSETARVAAQLRDRLSLEAVGRHYKTIIDEIVESSDSLAPEPLVAHDS